MRHFAKWPISSDAIIRASFLERPNRFLVRCFSKELGEVEAHLPNPGRLWGLLLPGATLYLHPSDKIQGGRQLGARKTQYTVLAVECDGAPVFLHTHLTNHVARHLMETGLISALAGTRVLETEVPAGAHRFDFLVQKDGKDLYIEIKSCTLFGNGVAMFPDAVTERGKRHLLALDEMGRKGIGTMVLFLVHTPRVEWFMPDYHTDLDFSRTLLKVRKHVQILAAAVTWKKDLGLEGRVKILKIPWGYLGKEVQDRGSYLLLVKLDEEKHITVGDLKTMRFAKGHYMYVGSAMRHLNARMARHQRKEKKLYWHVDYLTRVADSVLPIPVRSSQRLECHIVRALSTMMESGPGGFGSSDCGCPTHLFWSPTNPLQTEAFHRGILQVFWMRPP